jgi:hypothetical protein
MGHPLEILKNAMRIRKTKRPANGRDFAGVGKES